MEITIIISLILFAISVLLVFKFIKNIVAALASVVLLSLVFVAATGFFVYNDIRELQEKFPASTNVVLLTSEDEVLTGLILLPSDDFDPVGSMRMMSNTTLQEFDDLYSEDDIEAMKGVLKTSDFFDDERIENNGFADRTYKLIFVDYEVLTDAPIQTINVSSMVGASSESSKIRAISKDEALELLESDDPWVDFVEYVSVDSRMEAVESIQDQFNGTDLEIMTNETKAELISETADEIEAIMTDQFGSSDLKALIFMLNIGAILDEEKEGVTYLFTQFKDENIHLSDESVVFDVARLSPESLLTSVLDEGKNAAGEARSAVIDYQNQNSSE